MSELLDALTTPGAGFMPHGMCYAWQPGVLWLNVGSDALIAGAYLSIPFALVSFMRRREDLEFRWVFRLFAAFIVWCAFTHVLNIWVVWNPDYTAHGMVKLVTALVSVTTAVVLWPMIPSALALPGPAQLQRVNNELAAANDRLEARVAERTSELAETNRRLETEIRDRERSENALRSIADALPVLIGFIDAEERFNFNNAAWRDWFAAAPASLVGQTVAEVLGESNYAQHRDYLRGALAGERQRYESTLLRHDGELLDVDVALIPQVVQGDRVAGLYLLITDISDRAKQQERLRLVIDSAPSGMVLVDEEGSINLANREAESLFGYGQDELLGERIETLVPEGARSRHRRHRESYLQQPRARPMAEDSDLYAQRRDGTTFPVEIGLNPLQWDGRTHILASVVDIEHWKRAEQALEAAVTELRQSNEDLEQFAYAASHDLQEPLRAVSGCLELLKQRLGDELDDEGKELMTYAVDGADRMRVLIDDLLAYSRIDRKGSEFERVELANVVRDARAQLEVAIEESGARIEVPEALPAVRGDRSQLVMLFQNLLSNAIKYRTEETPLVRISAERGSDEWTVSVQDNGIGIAPEHQGRVFEVFKRLHTRRQYPGTGIGLAICVRIAKRHGGRLWVESEAGQGSVFYFTLPDSGEDRR